MTYLQFHLVFLVPQIVVFAWLFNRSSLRKDPGRYGHGNPLKWLLVMAGIALVYTTLWDNYLVYRGVWYYGEDRVLGTIGYVPIEEYLFFLLQPVFSGLFFYLLLAKKRVHPAGGSDRAARAAGAIVYLALAGLGVLCLQYEAGLYMGLILVWACPVLAGQWAYAGAWIWANRRLWFWSTVLTTLYLWVADRVALALGIWFIAEEYTTGWHLFGLPIEEATFFLVTNLLVIQGLFLFLHVGDPAQSALKQAGQVSG